MIRFLVIAAFFFGITHFAFPQQNILERRVSVSEKNMPLEEVLFRIAEEGGFSVSYNANHINGNQTVSLDVNEEKVRNCLPIFLDPQRYDFKVNGDHLVIIQKRIQEEKKPFKIDIRVKGRVFDKKTNKGLSKVTVFNIETLQSTYSDENGNFDFTFADQKISSGIAFIKKYYSDTVIVLQSDMFEVDIYLKPEIDLEKTEGIKDSSMLLTARLNALPVVNIFTSDENIYAEGDREIYQTRTAQISILPFLGTNLKMSGVVENNFSLNIFAGYSAATKGFEFGGLANITKYHMHGVQGAGIANVVGRESSGVQVAGIANTNLGSVNGLQASGIINHIQGDLRGVQLSGIIGTLNGQMNGAQLAGISTLTTKNVDGLQLAGFANIALKNVDKIQISGIYNQGKNITGLQLSGGLNTVTNEADGYQLAGIGNYAKNLRKIQLAGIFNIVSNDISGFQLAGVFNYAKKIKGVQFSVLNISDTVSGASIGIINLVRKGYNKAELYSNDVLYYGARIKFGTQRFYNMITFGTQSFDTESAWGYGYGFGSYFTLSKKTGISLDLTATDIQNTDEWIEQMNIMSRLELNFAYRVTEWFQVFIGTSFNSLFIEPEIYAQDDYLHTLAPWVQFESYSDNLVYQGWFGINGGFRFF